MRTKIAVAMFAVGLLVGACGGSDGDGEGSSRAASCRIVDDDGTILVCTQYVGSVWKQSNGMPDLCPDDGLHKKANSCPKEGAAGYCKMLGGSPGEHHQYSYNPIDEENEAFKDSCEGILEGEWVSF